VSEKANEQEAPTTKPLPAHAEPWWARLSDEKLLDLRLCDLGLKIEGTWLDGMIAKLYDELAQRGLAFRPHFWLSEEWFSPDGVPGVAIPFYLAHPRLMKLEQRMILEVEGGTRDWCLKILRHETGHAIDTAYGLRRKRRWQRVFGLSSRPYPDSYHPRPFSRHFVLHLDWWYAQSHPLEDFAETFAVWLRPRSRWRREYAGWPARNKLEFVDDLMREMKGKKPPRKSRERTDPVSRIRHTLREHYAAKRERMGIDLSGLYDQDLLRLFAADGDPAPGRSAIAFLRNARPELRQLVSQWTQQHPYMVDQFLRDMMTRCRALRLRLRGPVEQAKLDTAVLLTVQVMNYLRRGGHWIEL